MGSDHNDPHLTEGELVKRAQVLQNAMKAEEENQKIAEADAEARAKREAADAERRAEEKAERKAKEETDAQKRIEEEARKAAEEAALLTTRAEKDGARRPDPVKKEEKSDTAKPT